MMDHVGSSSSANQYAQGEPFFDLLQTNPNSGYSGSQKSPPVYFGDDDVLPSMDFQPMMDTGVKGKVDDSKRGWPSQHSNTSNSVRF